VGGGIFGGLRFAHRCKYIILETPADAAKTQRTRYVLLDC
jgi:hypothetical protein